MSDRLVLSQGTGVRVPVGVLLPGILAKSRPASSRIVPGNTRWCRPRVMEGGSPFVRADTIVRGRLSPIGWGMPQREFLDVDPRAPRLPGSRLGGADPYKLQQQIARFGSGQIGMPPPLVYRGSDGALMLIDGVTRATRIAKLAAGTTIRVGVIRTAKYRWGTSPILEIRSHESGRPRRIAPGLVGIQRSCPRARLGQLITNLAFLARSSGPSDVYDVEDDELLEAARSHLQDFERRSEPIISGTPT